MIGENIKAARIEAGLTQKQLAEKVDVNYQRIQKWEYGLAKPSIDGLKKLSVALGKTMEELMGAD